MTKLLVVLFALLTSSLAQAQPELKPIIDYMRTAPAWVDGHIALNASKNLHNDGTTSFTILKGKGIIFSFRENQLELRSLDAFAVKYHGFNVKISEVSWDSVSGFSAKASLNADITGLSRNYVGRSVSESLEKILGEKMRLANQQLYRVRGMNHPAMTIDIVKAILRIFATGPSTEPFPTYRGEVGLTFYPETNKAFSLYGMRMGLKAQDAFRMGFSFNGDSNGIIPYTGTLTSVKGMDLNAGLEFKQNARLVVKFLEATTEGLVIDSHLGVSETIGTVISVVEEIARASGKPVRSCDACYELALLSPIRLAVEGQFRASVLKQLDAYYQILRNLNYRPSELALFKKKETCRVTGANCVRDCRLKENSTGAIKGCIQRCETKMNQCLR